MQSNTRAGDLPVVAGEDLTGKEGLLVKLASSNGVAVALLPTANTDQAQYVLIEGSALGQPVNLRPLSPGRNVRVFLKGAVASGDVVVLADVAAPADIGKVRKIPAVNGTYRGLGIAEADGVDGQLALVRPISLGNITV